MTEEDQLNPVYCARCKRHTPRAVLGEFPWCPDCRAAADEERRAQAQAQQALAKQEARLAEERRQATYAVDTHLGQCPQCGSRNLNRFRTGGTDGTAQAATCCVGCLFFWPMMLLAPFLFRRAGEWHARCNACGHQWRV